MQLQFSPNYVLSYLFFNVEVWRLPFNPTKSGDFAEHLASTTLRRTGAEEYK